MVLRWFFTIPNSHRKSYYHSGILPWKTEIDGLPQKAQWMKVVEWRHVYVPTSFLFRAKKKGGAVTNKNRAINRYKYQTLLGCIADIWPALWWVCERVVGSHRKMTINHWEVDILNSETNPNLFINEPFPATIGWFYMCLHCSPATISWLSQAPAISRDIVPTMDVSLKTKTIKKPGRMWPNWWAILAESIITRV
jgi:hypothetical protein